MHQLLCRLHSSFGGFSSSVSSGFGSVGSASGSSVSSGTGSGFDSASNGWGGSWVGSHWSSVSRSWSRCGFHRCRSSSRRWRLNRCFFFFTASGHGNSGEQGGDQEGFFHEKFHWMCTKRSKTLESTKKKPESFFELDRFSLTPICKCVSRLEGNHTTEKSTGIYPDQVFLFHTQNRCTKATPSLKLQTQRARRQRGASLLPPVIQPLGQGHSPPRIQAGNHHAVARVDPLHRPARRPDRAGQIVG